MTLVPSTAASAVYHDALITARGFRNLCFFVLLLILVIQLALFFTARFTDNIIPVQGSRAERQDVTVPDIETEEVIETERQAGGTVETETEREVRFGEQKVEARQVAAWLYMMLYFTLWAGLVFALLLSMTLIFTTLVMLNGRTIGVSRVAGAFFWSLVLLLLLFPWQAVLNHPTLTAGVSGEAFHLPGVLYTWMELDAQARFPDRDWLGWVRFVFWPLVALVVLLVVQMKARRGVREALGEDLAEVDADRPVS